jgi:hypothetical protein
VEAEKLEEGHLKKCVEDSIYIIACLLDNKETKRQNNTFFPFDHLYKK